MLLIQMIIIGAWAEPMRESATFTGQVTDASDGKPLIGVTIYFPELRQGTTTDTDGNFKLSGLPAKKS